MINYYFDFEIPIMEFIYLKSLINFNLHLFKKRKSRFTLVSGGGVVLSILASVFLAYFSSLNLQIGSSERDSFEDTIGLVLF